MLVFLLLIPTICFSLDIEYYYGEGCPHCAVVTSTFDELGPDYGLNITTYEVYSNAENRESMFRKYDQFGVDVRNGGVPTTIVGGKTFVVGQLNKTMWENIFDECRNSCPEDVILEKSSELLETDSASSITLPVLIGAAIVDSINPCTIAVLILLISAVLYSKGQKRALISGVLFSFTIFAMYLLYGFGIMHVLTTFELTRIFYIVVTVAAFILAILEVRAFIDYKPGLAAVEMPMFMRPYAKKVTSRATSLIAVVIAAVFCSIFLIPCSSGPYLIVLGQLAKSATLQTVSYLILYNLIFILPMLLLTVLIYFGKTTVEKIGAAKEKYIRIIHLISGIILFILFFLMTYQLQQLF